MKFEAILFDLDGTLLNTLEDLADSANAVLAQRGHPTHPVEAYKYFVGGGIRNLVVKMLPEDERDEGAITACISEVRDEYSGRWDKKTHSYKGIPEMLSELAARKMSMSVYSNKPDEFTKKCVERFLGDFPFKIVVGARPGFPGKPDPTVALNIAGQLGVAPETFLYLGDTSTDMQTATSAGMYAAGVLWGFRTAEELQENGAQVLLKKPSDALELI